MKAKTQLNQFKRIQAHYQQELDTLTSELGKRNARVSILRLEFEQIEQRLKTTELRLAPHAVSVENCQLGGQLLLQITEQWNDKFLEFSKASEAFEEQRSKVRLQMSRIKSLEKLVERKSTIVAHEEQRREQFVADERYLNTSLARGNQ
jgi:flagellar biosynthesis chaperone FliJ